MPTFNADEILEMAEAIERNGRAFYNTAAENNSDAEASKMLRKLAEMEQEHLKTFQDMRDQFRAAGEAPAMHDPDGTGALYLRAMVESKIFDMESDPASVLDGSESLAEILRTAVGLEKDSVVFYLAMKDVVPADHHAQIDAIIREEMSHISMLTTELVKQDLAE